MSDSHMLQDDPRPGGPWLAAVESSLHAGGASVSNGGELTLDLTGELDRAESVDLGQPPGLLGATRWQRFAKRAVDVVGSGLLIVLLSPLLILAAMAIAVTSRGPVLYVQERVGKGGRLFRMLKFRSMRVQAHDDRDNIIHLNEVSGPVFKIREDPRITRVGRVMRRFSVDELPQLANVLVGQMSLVGPRPPLPDEVESYDSRERRRLTVRPGLTCIWQVSGRSDLEFDTWVDLDLQYIDSWTLGLDTRLLLRTFSAVWSGRGAY